MTMANMSLEIVSDPFCVLQETTADQGQIDCTIFAISGLYYPQVFYKLNFILNTPEMSHKPITLLRKASQIVFVFFFH